MTADVEQPLLTREDVRQLERFSLDTLEAINVGLVGQREGASRGEGVEFADYRPYTPGDDLRRIDWHVFARQHELVVKMAPGESRASLSVMLDASRSMDLGEPNKLRYGRRLTALLGTVALLRSDAIQVQVLSDGNAVAGGQLDAPGMLAALAFEVAQLPSGRTTQLERSVRRARISSARQELAVLISDCLTPPDDLNGALRELGQSATAATLLHVLDPTEASPALRGSVELQDRETGQRLVATMTDELVHRYLEHYREFLEATQAACRANGIHYVPASTSVDPLELLVESGRRGVMMQARTGA
jgi:uncharacterized protein (DUF58 family)